jgi:hypothetical protein
MIAIVFLFYKLDVLFIIPKNKSSENNGYIYADR